MTQSIKLADIIMPFVKSEINFHSDLNCLEDEIYECKQRIDSENQKLKALQDELKQKTDKTNHAWVDQVITPIADELIKFYPNHRIELMGPSPVESEVTILVIRDDVPNPYDYHNGIRSISFIPQYIQTTLHGGKGFTGFNLLYKDYSKSDYRPLIDTNKYLDDVNYPKIALSSQCEISDLVRKVA